MQRAFIYYHIAEQNVRILQSTYSLGFQTQIIYNIYVLSEMNVKFLCANLQIQFLWSSLDFHLKASVPD